MEELGEDKLISLNEAIDLAKDRGLDLVQVNKTGDNVVCKIMDYSKFIYGKKKMAKNNRKKSVELKEIRMGNSISEHDMSIKANNVNRILKNGNNVRVTVFFKGRAIKNVSNGIEMLHNILDKLTVNYEIYCQPKIEGNRVYMILHSQNK